LSESKDRQVVREHYQAVSQLLSEPEEPNK
jgi:hypothetical protein